MGDIYRDPRYRDRDDGSEDEYRHTTVRRYKIKPSHDGRYENIDVEDDHRSRFSGRTRDEPIEFERRSERPRSVLEATDDRRSAFYEREAPKEYSYGDPDRGRIMVYESKDSDQDDKRSRHTHRDDEIRVERRYEERYEDSLGHDVDRYRKETEYYTRPSPPPPPVIIRQRQEPQQIILQEAPPPAPVIIPRQEPGVLVVRDQDHHHHHHHREHSRRDRERDHGGEEYYYRHEKREVGSWRGDPDRDHAMAMARFDRHRHREGHYSDEDDDGYWVHSRRIVRRERSESPHHKRHLAAGALAGAGITALMTSRQDSNGEVQDHRGRKVIAGTALGALGTEAIRRAHSAYGERYRGRSESPGHHSKLKTGLGIAAVALAAAGAAKYYKANKVEKEEARRGRSRKRSHSRRSHRSAYSGSYSRSPSRSRSRSRRRSLSTVAKAALGTAATAGLVKHFRNKSKARSGSRSKSRSKSRLRTAAEIGGAAAAAGVATKMWKNHKDKKERRSRERDLSDDDRAYSRRGSPSNRSISRGGSRSRSRSRSLARSSHLDSADPELGLVEYGRDPLRPDDPPVRGYETEAEERRRRRRRRREREVMSDDEGTGAERKRSKSRLRDMAAAGVASGAAAFGIKDYKDRKDAEKKERRSRERRERDRTRERSIDHSPDQRRTRSRDVSRDVSRDRSRDRSRNRSRRGGEAQSYFDGHGRSSPPTASGGAYYPPYPATPNAGASSGGYAPYPSSSTPGDVPYAPHDYMGYVPPPPPNNGHPPSGPGPAGGYPAPPPGPPSGPQDHIP